MAGEFIFDCTESYCEILAGDSTFLCSNLLNCRSKFYRQTLIFSSMMIPEINAVFNKHCHSILVVAHKSLCPK